jgi:hypothetical protein
MMPSSTRLTAATSPPALGCLLRGNLRRRQNRDCDNQAETSGGAMHNLFSRQLSASENDDL